MPNHVTNYLQVLGEPDRVAEFFEKAKTLNSHGELSEFTFHAFVPMPSETFRGDLGQREQLEFPGDFNWYDWSIRHWGTKWDAYSIERLAPDLIQFDTAWSAPTRFYWKCLSFSLI